MAFQIMKVEAVLGSVQTLVLELPQFGKRQSFPVIEAFLYSERATS